MIRRYRKTGEGMTEKDLIQMLRKFDQGHILEHYERLSGQQKLDFLGGLEGLDFERIFSLYRDAISGPITPHTIEDIGPAPIIPIPETTGEKALEERARLLGESMLRAGKVAVLIVAGGQGSRLGHDGPKGTFPVSPVKKKTLFQLFCESVKAISIRYGARIPLLIMTSRENGRDTRTYFESCNYFGLDREDVHFFSQSMLPTITPEGRLILRDNTHIVSNPDGHGGSLKAIHDSGLLKRLEHEGITELFYCQVDNPLVKIADPVFLGHHGMVGAEMSTKVVRRKTIEERVGVYVSIAGKEGIIEYSDFGGRHMSSLDTEGEILYWAGNTAIHAINLSFINRLNTHGFALPYHLARRTVEAMAPEEGTIEIEGWKFETFVFDAIGFAKKTCSMEVVRDEEFSPVKNSQGNDSPATAAAAMSNLYRSWLEGAGLKSYPHKLIEISPLFALDKEELAHRLVCEAPDQQEGIYWGD
jgi:UDP-N-acetylglucosamine/UDP-N-acetylgalactosamine diphosphorylase